MTIKRDRYLNRLIERRHNGFVKIITGIRRCGKSFLLFNLFRDDLRGLHSVLQQIVEVALDMRKFAALPMGALAKTTVPASAGTFIRALIGGGIPWLRAGTCGRLSCAGRPDVSPPRSSPCPRRERPQACGWRAS